MNDGNTDSKYTYVLLLLLAYKVSMYKQMISHLCIYSVQWNGNWWSHSMIAVGSVIHTAWTLAGDCSCSVMIEHTVNTCTGLDCCACEVYYISIV